MEAELAALAASGATTVVGLMASDAWTQVRDRLARFFARGGGADGAGAAGAGAVDERAVDERASGEAAVTAELQLSQAELMAARASSDVAAAADVEAALRTRLRRVLRADPAAAAELRLLLAELAPVEDSRPVTVVQNTVSGGVHRGSVIVQGQNVNGVNGGGDPGGGPVLR